MRGASILLQVELRPPVGVSRMFSVSVTIDGKLALCASRASLPELRGVLERDLGCVIGNVVGDRVELALDEHRVARRMLGAE